MDKLASMEDATDQRGVPTPGLGMAGKIEDFGVSDLFGIGMRICNSVHEHARLAVGTGRSYVLSDMVREGDGVVFTDHASSAEFLEIQAKRGRALSISCLIVDPKLGLTGVERANWTGRKYGRLLFDHKWLEEYYAYHIADMQRRLAVTAAMYSKDGL